MMVAATDRGLCFVQFGESDDELLAMLRDEYPSAALAPMKQPYPEELGVWIGALSRHLEGDQPRLDLPVDVRATAFRRKVWDYLKTIPCGQVRSYTEVAAAIGQPTAARAVAQACAANPVAIAIPCHRVICGNGALGGYRWGIERKQALIAHERIAHGGSSRVHG
jgi:AraC family transcriptional regulator of adaptative response/methylated-DNA-[protein]-cysteine methyltransferase